MCRGSHRLFQQQPASKGPVTLIARAYEGRTGWTNAKSMRTPLAARPGGAYSNSCTNACLVTNLRSRDAGRSHHLARQARSFLREMVVSAPTICSRR